MTAELDFNSETILDWFNKNLENLSTINEGSKIYINRDNIIIQDEPYMFQGLWRYYNNIKRGDALLIINKLFDNIERYYNSLYIKSCMIKNKQKIVNIPESIVNEVKNIIENIELSKNGLINLKITYKDDPITVLELDKILININNIINNFKKLFLINYF
jgi:hypothetical protein